MPYKRNYKRKRPYRRRRRVRKMKVAKAPIYRRPSTQNQIPNVMKLRYCENILLNSVDGSLASARFSANSCHIPFVGGHQPMKWDQMKLFYNHYVVIGSKITAKYLGGSNITATNIVATGIDLNDDTALAGTDFTTIVEQGRTQFKLVAESADVKTQLSSKYSAKRFYNIKNIKDNLDRLGAQVTSSPAEEAYYHLWARSLSTGNFAGRYMIVIDYIVLFSEPCDVAAS